MPNFFDQFDDHPVGRAIKEAADSAMQPAAGFQRAIVDPADKAAQDAPPGSVEEKLAQGGQFIAHTMAPFSAPINALASGPGAIAKATRLILAAKGAQQAGAAAGEASVNPTAANIGSAAGSTALALAAAHGSLPGRTLSSSQPPATANSAAGILSDEVQPAAAIKPATAAAKKAERVTAGVTTFKDADSFSPANQEAARIALRDTAAQTPGVKSVRVTHTEGLYGGSSEPSFDMDVAVKPGSDISPITQKVIDIGRDANQMDVFVSKLVGPDHPNARPAFEITFPKKATPEMLQEVVNEFRNTKSANFPDGLDGFTLAKNSRGEVIGIRAQYIPEISGRWDETHAHLDPTKVGDLADEWHDNAKAAIDSLNKKLDITSHAQSVSTRVIGTEDYATAKPDSLDQASLADRIRARNRSLGRESADAGTGDAGAQGAPVPAQLPAGG